MSAPVSLRILVVEDESMIAMMVEELLHDLGHSVAGIAAHLEDGLAKAASLAFDVAMLDFNLNGRASLPIAELLMQRGTPFLFMTGYGFSVPASLPAVPILRKPFRAADIERALQKVMGGTTAREAG